MQHELSETRKKSASDTSSEMSGRSRRPDISDEFMIVRGLLLSGSISCQI